MTEQKTQPVPCAVQHTAPLDDFEPPAQVLPFEGPPKPPAARTALLENYVPRPAMPFRDASPPTRAPLDLRWVLMALAILLGDAVVIYLILRGP